MDPVETFVACKTCRFWDDSENGLEGFCRRNAPRPQENALRVARWPETRATEGCGEGATNSPAEEPVRCAACVFWLRPGQGIEPGLRGDHQAAWWRGAGFCRRFSPTPGFASGARAFWPVTHDDDRCFAGRSA